MGYSELNVLITGGAGFIGSHLVDECLKNNWNVVVIDNLSVGRTQNFSQHISNPNFKFFEKDISEFESIAPLFKDIDVVFHLGARADIVPSIQMPSIYHKANVDGTITVLEASRLHGVKKIIYAASSSCYGLAREVPTKETSTISPQYPYALTKWVGEEYVMHWSKVYGLSAISLRFFNVFGPRSRTSGTYGAVFGVFLSQKLHNQPLTVVGDGTQTRDFTYVSDVVSALIVASQSNESGEIFNVGSGGTYSVNHLVSLIGGPVTYIPKRPGEPDCTLADISKIKKHLGWLPKVKFEDGVNELLKDISVWKDAPLWTVDSISTATQDWFKYLGK